MLLDFIDINPQNGSMYIQLYNEIKRAIHSGIIKSGEQLPSIREAAFQLKVSRTTIENAYIKLCIEGLAESRPCRGYYICKRTMLAPKPELESKPNVKIQYDFSGRNIDINAADTDLWRKTVREVLRNTKELISYGDSQGEIALRNALVEYSYKARGVKCRAENIIIGAGIGPLLNILCGLIDRRYSIGIENGGFNQAEQIFKDYGIKTQLLESDKSGAVTDAIKKSDADIIFMMPSSLAKISITELSTRRNSVANWLTEKPERLVIEDDYNGELRITARTVTAFQGTYPESTVYIGSFSKLLLPSLRIAYMVLPNQLAEEYARKKQFYNQTCGKIDQLALTDYIESGALERHLRRLRKLYSRKSQSFIRIISEILPECKTELFESSLTVSIKADFSLRYGEIMKKSELCGIKIIPFENEGEIRLCFAGIAESDMRPAITLLKSCLI